MKKNSHIIIFNIVVIQSGIFTVS